MFCFHFSSKNECLISIVRLSTGWRPLRFDKRVKTNLKYFNEHVDRDFDALHTSDTTKNTLLSHLYIYTLVSNQLD